MTAGATPIRTSVKAKVASGPADRDVARAEQAEAARPHVPGDPGDDGLGQLDDLPQQGDEGRRVGRLLVRSAPAQNVLPVWVSTTARTSGSWPHVGERVRELPHEAARRARCGCPGSRG